MPLIILRVSPMALLMSVLYNYSNLGKNNELISIRTSGISALRTAYPAIVLAIFISFLTFFLQEKVLRDSQFRMEQIKSRYIEKEDAESQINNLAFKSDGSIFFIETFLPKEKELKNAIIFKHDSQGALTGKIESESIKYRQDRWIAYDAVEYNFEASGRLARFPIITEEKDIELTKKPEELAFEQSIFIEFAPLKSISEQISSLQRFSPGALLASLRVEFHRKIAFPFSHLFLIIGSLPLALEIKKKKGAFVAIGIGLLFALAYFLIDSVSLALGKSEIILPLFSAWLAPLFFVSIGITGLLLMR